MSNDNPMYRKDMYVGHHAVGPYVDYETCYDGVYVLCEDVVARIEELLESNYSVDVLEMIKEELS